MSIFLANTLYVFEFVSLHQIMLLLLYMLIDHEYTKVRALGM